MADVEKESIHSVEGSVTDSGRGPSEEGEAGHARHNRERCIPPPPPPPRGAYWLLPKKCHGGLQQHHHHHHQHQSVRFQGVDGEDDTAAAAAVAEVFPNRTVNLGGSPVGGVGAPPLPRGESRTLPCRKKHGRKDETDVNIPRNSVNCSKRVPDVEPFLAGPSFGHHHTGTAASLRVPAALLRRGEAFRATDGEPSPSTGDEVNRRIMAGSSSSLYGHAVLRRKSHDWSHDRDRAGGPGSTLVGPDVIV